MRKKRFFRRAVYEHPEQLYVAERTPERFLPWLDAQRKGRPLTLELGMGTGDFLFQHAKESPERFFLGVEIKPDRIYRSFEKAHQEGLTNIAFLQTPVERILEYGLGDLDQLYVLFPDPWPKDRHTPRRLTAPQMLQRYQALLGPQGVFCFKTDDGPLYEYSVESLLKHGWKLHEQVEGFETEERFRTLYERRFLDADKPIYYLEASATAPRFSFRKTSRRLIHFLSRS